MLTPLLTINLVYSAGSGLLKASPPTATVLLNLGLLPATPVTALRVHFRFSWGQGGTELVKICPHVTLSLPHWRQGLRKVDDVRNQSEISWALSEGSVLTQRKQSFWLQENHQSRATPLYICYSLGYYVSVRVCRMDTLSLNKWIKNHPP